jgi:hypothetical protein
VSTTFDFECEAMLETLGGLEDLKFGELNV